MSELKTKLEAWVREANITPSGRRPKSAFEAIELLWPVIEAAACDGDLNHDKMGDLEAEVLRLERKLESE